MKAVHKFLAFTIGIALGMILNSNALVRTVKPTRNPSRLDIIPTALTTRVTEGRVDLRQLDPRGTQARCVNRGMQRKCVFTNLIVEDGTFRYLLPRASRESSSTREILASELAPFMAADVPNPIYPADGQIEPLSRYHKYRGHRFTPFSSRLTSIDVQTRPTIFLFRMSGHSTYHLWENNIGPFYSTIQDHFDLPNGTARRELHSRLSDPNQLLIAFVDTKPTTGPKAPTLLNHLLQLFSSAPLVNVSLLRKPTLFKTAVVGISSHSFPHRKLVDELLWRMLRLRPGPNPNQPRCLYISRNHPTVIRGRKVMNEAAMLPALRSFILNSTGSELEVVYMEDKQYLEQVRIAAGANIMFSPHGGGVANCVWMNRGSVMVEFVAPVGRTLPGMYHSMCSRSGVKHFSFLADPDPRDASLTDNPRLFSNMIVPPQRIIENAAKALKLYGG